MYQPSFPAAKALCHSQQLLCSHHQETGLKVRSSEEGLLSCRVTGSYDKIASSCPSVTRKGNMLAPDNLPTYVLSLSLALALRESSSVIVDFLTFITFLLPTSKKGSVGSLSPPLSQWRELIILFFRKMWQCIELRLRGHETTTPPCL